MRFKHDLTAAEINKRLRGRRIVKVLLRPFSDGVMPHPGRATDPVIVLDDGTEIKFLTQETQVGEYGVALIVSDPVDSTTGQKS